MGTQTHTHTHKKWNMIDAVGVVGRSKETIKMKEIKERILLFPSIKKDGR